MGGDDVVSGYVKVAGVEADGYGSAAGLEGGDQLGDLFEFAAERELGAGGVFDQDAEVRGLAEVEPGDGVFDGLLGELEAFVAGEAFPAAGMEDEVFGAECEGSLDLAAEGSGGVEADGFGLAAEVDEVAGVDGDGADVVFGSEFAHLCGVFRFDGGGLPLTGARGEDLEGVCAGFDGSIDCCPTTACGA